MAEKKHTLKNEKGKKSGEIQFLKFEIIEKPSFVQYLKSGWKVNFIVGIDFTASNKDKHVISFEKGVNLNQYEIAIQEVGKILQPYAYQKMVAGFGFGAIPTY